ncbi:ATP-binding protein [Streptomyces sp. WMMB 322]|uniref:ATP-binding protein n=1 Tax=Streptomyces sp. WMMB 322 TaxID=1286821 RepID=UPI0020C7AECE|nr:ATP-binding protein [Streptomyces sp. WMMB 322]
MAQNVPASSTMTVPHGPAGVGAARRRMRADLLASGAAESVVDDAVLVLSELLSNSCRHARPLSHDDSVRASWNHGGDGELTISVTDGGGPTRPLPATPSVSARGGRGLAIIGALARDWGVREERHEFPGGVRQSETEPSSGVTVWVVLSAGSGVGRGLLEESLAFDMAAADEVR